MRLKKHLETKIWSASFQKMLKIGGLEARQGRKNQCVKEAKMEVEINRYSRHRKWWNQSIIKNQYLQNLQNPQKIIIMASGFPGVAGKIFRPFYETQSRSPEEYKIIMASELNVSFNATEQVLAQLTPTHFLIKNSDGKTLRAELNFQIKFQVVLQNQDSIKSRKVGFRILQQNCDQQVYFSHSSPELITKWVNVLKTRISQVGFHKFYKALRRLGKGQFATVFQVESIETGAKFAVKGFSKLNLKRIPKGIESLQNEIKIMRSFTHKNLQKLQGVYQTENSIYLVNELLKGGSLFDRLQKLAQHKKKLSLENIREFMSGLLSGLTHLSRYDIVHRDLKLDNIVLRRMDSFEPVIIDFGLATFSTQASYLYYRCGTPGFVSPQVMACTTANKVQPISDIFSAGAIFHHLLTEKPVFPGSTPEQVLVQNKRYSFNLLSESYSNLDSDAFCLLSKMLEIDPNKRIGADDAVEHEFFNRGDKLYSPLPTTICESEKLLQESVKF